MYTSDLTQRVRFVEGLDFGEDGVFLLMLLSSAKRMVCDIKYCGYHYIRRAVSLSNGRTVLDVAMSYWRDTVALYKSDLPSRCQSLFREWVVRALSGHLVGVFRWRDAIFLTTRFSTPEGVMIWKCLRKTASDPEDRKMYSGCRFQVWGYGMIFGHPRGATSSVAVSLLELDVSYRSKNKLSS